MNKVGHRYKLWGSGKVWGPGFVLPTIVAACPLCELDSPMEAYPYLNRHGGSLPLRTD